MKLLFFLILLTFITSLSSAVRYDYSYDDAGNRIARAVVIFKQSAPEEQKLSDITITVYPNPVQNYLRIDIAGLTMKSK